MSELIVNASPMWHPTNGLDLTTYMKLPSGQRNQAYFDFEGNTPETSSFYIGLFIDSGQKKRYRINRLYAPNYFSSYEYRHCGIFYLDGSTYKLELCDNGGGSQNALLFYEYYIDTYNENTNTWTSQRAGSSTRSITLSMSSVYSNGCININNPYIPIFATNELVTAYLNDPEDETIYSQALNYYNPIDHSQPHYEMRRYFRGVDTSIENYINSMFDTDNSNYNNFIDEVLDPINNLVKSRINMDYNTSINESLQKVKDSLTQVVNLKGMQLVNNPTESDIQVAFPNKVLTPLINFTPLTQEQLITIIDYFDNEKDVTADKGYFLTCHGYNSSNNRYEIYCCTFENKDNTHNYSNLYLEKTGTGSTVVRTKPEYYLQGGGIRIKKMSWGSCSIERYYYYPSTDTISYSSSISDYVISNDKRYILLNKMNDDLPFYCSGDVYMAYRENDEDDWKNYLFLQKNSSEVLEVVPVASALMHIKPIIMLYNRYQLSFLNGWDGNKLEMGDYYMIAPQFGAGVKEDDNSFSGVVMGTKLKDINNSNERLMGVFGQYHGRQSFFLNSDDGSAIFGLEKRGQITMDPTQNKALIYSGNYWKDYKYDGKPINYNDTNMAKDGMLIDLTTPQIRFGNGNFVVTSAGHLTAKGGGSIAGWKIDDSCLYSNVGKGQGRLTLDSGTTTLYGYNLVGTRNNTSVNCILYCQVLNDSSTAKIFKIKYNDTNYSNFYFTWDPTIESPNPKGTLVLENSITILINENLTTDNLIYTYINGRTAVETEDQYQYPGKFYSHTHDSFAANNTGFYLSYDGFSIGSNFKVNSLGNLQATDAVLSGTLNVYGNGQSRIGSWVVNADNLYSKVTRSDNPAGTFDITIGSDGNLFGKKLTGTDPVTGRETWDVQWEIRRDGDAYFKSISGEVPSDKNLNILGSLTVGGTASVSGTLTVGSKVTIDSSGITANAGNIGGFTIGTGYIGTNGSTAYLNGMTVGGGSGVFTSGITIGSAGQGTFTFKGSSYVPGRISAVTGIELYPDNTVKKVTTTSWDTLIKTE